MERCSESEYLISFGWLPSPTTVSMGAWEHEAFSLVPASCLPWSEEMGLYAPRWVRHTTAQASAITMAMEALHENCVVLPREAFDGQQ